jgi:hypothetical protein
MNKQTDVLKDVLDLILESLKNEQPLEQGRNMLTNLAGQHGELFELQDDVDQVLMQISVLQTWAKKHIGAAEKLHTLKHIILEKG